MNRSRSVAIAAAMAALLFAACADDEEPSGPALSADECAALQAEFDQNADAADLATRGGGGQDRALARMNLLDRQMQEGGCYG